MGELPTIGVLAITEIDFDGEMHGRPLAWREEEAPDIRVVAEPGAPALSVGERAVARFERLADGTYEARIIRAVAPEPERVLGVYRRGPEGGRIEPTDRKVKSEFRVAERHRMDARPGEIVLADIIEQSRFGPPEARIVERIGDSADPRSFSLIAIHAHGIPTIFPPEALTLAAEAQPVPLGRREDLRRVPLVTIDGADARDFDDAVWAEPDRGNEGGWHAIVAIADVSHYVRPGDALDSAAQERGNSVYFPDRVVPMLPEELSNELCSLKPYEDRATVAAHLHIAADGRLLRHRFVRGLMRSHARFTYEEVQDAIEGRPSDQARPLLKTVIEPLYGVYRALSQAREKRGTLELDLPERSIQLDPKGHVAKIEPRLRFDSHRVIEELMIAANVAAAETLERVKQPCMYRIHDRPDPAKLAALSEFLDGIGISGLRLAKGQVVRPRHFSDILKKAVHTPYATLISQLVLRSQAQAVYAPKNIGHFGLALRRYAHFTSPIRRYADLLVHRALVAGHRWGEGALEPHAPESFAVIGDHVSMTERRAAAAERSASDRYLAAFLAARVGATFHARVSGVTRAGLFITLTETGADGLVPMRSLPGDYYIHDEARHRLVGRRTRRTFTLGDAVTATLVEANSVTGSLLFTLAEEEAPRVAKRLVPRRKGR
jgi:ribonuclease R